MGARAEHRQRLRALDRPEWVPYLRRHSGLPGPRANLELVAAVADEGDPAIFDELAGADDEYLVLCGVVGLGRRLADGADSGIQARLYSFATDQRWRVREAVATGLQRLGDADLGRLDRIADAWAGDPHPLVQRAAVAGCCEPRLLRTAASAAHAVGLCERVTATLAARPAGQRRQPDVRALRQALGYCWSVAVAADPGPGLPRLLALAAHPDPDVGWIARENRKKARVATLLPR